MSYWLKSGVEWGLVREEGSGGRRKVLLHLSGVCEDAHCPVREDEGFAGGEGGEVPVLARC